MIGTSPQTTPNVQLVKDNTAKKLTVAGADPGNLKWSDFNISWTPTVTDMWLTYGSGSRLHIWDGLPATESDRMPLSTLAPTVYVTAGNAFNLTGTGTLTIRHVPTNTLVGTYTFS
jgi:hypothetical protein